MSIVLYSLHAIPQVEVGAVLPVSGMPGGVGSPANAPWFLLQDIDWVQTEKHVFEQASSNPFLVGLHSCFQTTSR